MFAGLVLVSLIFDTLQFIKDACAQALAEGKTKYAAAPGLPELRQALADQYYKHGSRARGQSRTGSG